MTKKFSKLLCLLAFFILLNCTKSTDPITGKEKVVEVNPQIKAKEFASKGGGILGDFTKNRGGTTYNFATSNVMWRATLKTLDFMPLQAIDYGGGIISTDWYAGDSSKSAESVKVTVKFLSDKVSASSFEITSHKKSCEKNMLACTIVKLDENFSNKIKEKILNEVTFLSIKDKQKEKENEK